MKDTLWNRMFNTSHHLAFRRACRLLEERGLNTNECRQAERNLYKLSIIVKKSTLGLA